MKKIIALLLMTVALSSSAKEVTIKKQWTAPTHNTDGSRIKEGEISEYRLFYSLDGPLDFSGDFFIVINETRFEFRVNLEPSEDEQVIRTSVKVMNTSGALSKPSNIVVDRFILKDTVTPNPATDGVTTIHCKKCIIEIR